MRNLPRKISKKLLFSLTKQPVVFLNGPRQAGKSTLVQMLADGEYPAQYISLDNITQMAAASSSPESFLRERNGPLIIDEVQMVPELFRALKLVVDELRGIDKSKSFGRFLLTGSANIMALPKLSDPLVGRMSIKTLYPLSVSEVIGSHGDFISSLFMKKFLTGNSLNLNEAVTKATFPEISGADNRSVTEWFDGYLTTILQRDIKMFAEIEKLGTLPVLLRVLANRAGGLMNDAEIARDVGLNPVTSKSYRNILKAMFLHFDVEPWHRNIGKRLVKSPKGYMIDTMLLCYLLGMDLEEVKLKRPELYGHVIENFVATELLKLLSFSDTQAKLLHFRSSDNKEVDFILEKPNGELAGIEVKAADRVSPSDFNGLKALQALTGNDFVCGVVIYSGTEIVPFGKNLYAIPFSTLWH